MKLFFRQAFIYQVAKNKPGNTTYQRTCYKSCIAGWVDKIANAKT